MMGLPARYAPVEGTSVLQAFDLNIGRIGLGVAEARKRGYNVVTSVNCDLDSIHYYSMHANIRLN